MLGLETQISPISSGRHGMHVSGLTIMIFKPAGAWPLPRNVCDFSGSVVLFDPVTTTWFWASAVVCNARMVGNAALCAPLTYSVASASLEDGVTACSWLPKIAT